MEARSRSPDGSAVLRDGTDMDGEEQKQKHTDGQANKAQLSPESNFSSQIYRAKNLDRLLYLFIS